MNSIKYQYWKEGEFWLGFIEEFPDYLTQGESEEDLMEHLKSLYEDLTSDEIPGIRRVGEFIIN